jgi:hypothetical protein
MMPMLAAQSDHSAQPNHLLSLLEIVSLLDVLSSLPSCSVALDDPVELDPEEVSPDGNHQDGYGRDVADPHEYVDDDLLPYCRAGDVEADEACDCHCGYAYEVTIDEGDVVVLIGSPEDARGNEGNEDEEEDMNTLRGQGLDKGQR